jgi:hypothetical protein
MLVLRLVLDWVTTQMTSIRWMLIEGVPASCGLGRHQRKYRHVCLKYWTTPLARHWFFFFLSFSDHDRRFWHCGQHDRCRDCLEERDAQLVQPAPRQPRLLRLHLLIRGNTRKRQVRKREYVKSPCMEKGTVRLSEETSENQLFCFPPTDVCAILLRIIIENLFRYFKSDRLSIPIIDILGATDYLPICW